MVQSSLTTGGDNINPGSFYNIDKMKERSEYVWKMK